jgi:YD repeat-containing protein
VNDVTFANAAHWIQDKDPYSMARPSRFRTTNTGANWDSGAYGYDGAGNITAIGLDSYYYDKVGRILYGTTQNGVASQSYTYDTYGNLKSIGTTRSGVTTSGVTAIQRVEEDARYD